MRKGAFFSNNKNLRYPCYIRSKVIMRGKLMLKKVIFIVKLNLCPIWCWPLPKDASKFKVFCKKLYHYFSIILIIGLEVPLIYTATYYLDEPTILIELVLEISTLAHGIFNFISHEINAHHIQVINILTYVFNIRTFKCKLVKESLFVFCVLLCICQ